MSDPIIQNAKKMVSEAKKRNDDQEKYIKILRRAGVDTSQLEIGLNNNRQKIAKWESALIDQE